MSEETSTGGQF